MGCDIHFHVEKKDENGKWISADKWTVDPWGDDDPDYIDVKREDSFYHDRNYLLFGILAHVRDRSVTPISSPRGLPKDVSPEVKKRSDDYGADGHSHSWLTLAELLAYDWDVAMNTYAAPTSFVRETLPKLQALGSPENVRIVFFFDN